AGVRVRSRSLPNWCRVAVLPSTSVQTLGSSPTPSPTSLIAFSPSNLIPTTPSSHVGCCAIAPRCTRLRSPHVRPWDLIRPAFGPKGAPPPRRQLEAKSLPVPQHQDLSHRLGTSRQHRRYLFLPSPRGQLRYANRLRRPR